MKVNENINKIRELYKHFQNNTSKIDEAWITFFEDLDTDAIAYLSNETNYISDINNNISVINLENNSNIFFKRCIIS